MISWSALASMGVLRTSVRDTSCQGPRTAGGQVPSRHVPGWMEYSSVCIRTETFQAGAECIAAHSRGSNQIESGCEGRLFGLDGPGLAVPRSGQPARIRAVARQLA